LNTNNISMRIAYLINQYPKVSHTFIRREIHALEELGFEVMRIALRGWDSELVDPQDFAERERTRYVLYDGASALLLAMTKMALTRPMHFARALALAWRMSRRAERPLPVHLIYLAEACRIEGWLKTTRIQHLHAHFGTNSAEIAMFVRALGGPRWSFTVHGPEEFDKAPLISLADKIRACSFVVAVSSYGRSQLYRLVEHEHWPKVQLIYCGLHLASYSVSTDSAPHASRLVCVGRLCEQKGQLLLVEAAQRIAAQTLDFELVFVGDGELRTEIQSLIVRCNLTDKIHITGWLNDEHVRDEILAARALVLPSFAEGLPIVLMEAMALKRPVISTHVAGIPELLRSGESGWLVPPGDVEALVNAMRACLNASPDLLRRMGQAGRKRIIAQHDIKNQAAQLALLFQRAGN
jgi:colanic acid/amylovoran biosynthesis glycosyltransferase